MTCQRVLARSHGTDLWSSESNQLARRPAISRVAGPALSPAARFSRTA